MMTRFLLLASIAGILAASTVHAADSSEKTRKLIAVLQSDAGLYEKARACQELGETGDRTAVPALAQSLTDPHLSAYARSGLEGIPDPSASAALRKAADVLQGPLLAGVINSLGVLRDEKAVPLLSKLAGNSDVAKEALI